MPTWFSVYIFLKFLSRGQPFFPAYRTSISIFLICRPGPGPRGPIRKYGPGYNNIKHLGALFCGLMCPRHYTGHSSPSSAKVKNGHSCIFTAPHVFMACIGTPQPLTLLLSCHVEPLIVRHLSSILWINFMFSPCIFKVNHFYLPTNALTVFSDR